MSIYTGGGDKGRTSLLSGERIAKADPMVEAYGSIDELTAQLGVCRAYLNRRRFEAFAELILAIQRDLFRLGMQLSSNPGHWENLPSPLTGEDVRSLEKTIDSLEQAFGLPTFFVSPGASLTGAALHVARTVCRRAERRALAATAGEPCYAILLKYLNRLSDLLFSLSWAAETRIMIRQEASRGQLN